MPEKMKVTKKAILMEICCFLLVLLFLYASVSKYLDFKGFKDAMHNQPFPLWLSDFFIWTVPPFEILISLAIVSHFIGAGKIRKYGLYGSLFLMSAFTLYTVLVLAHTFGRVPCSCGGVINGLNWWQHSIFNLFFVGVSLFALRLERKAGTPESVTGYSKNIVVNAV